MRLFIAAPWHQLVMSSCPCRLMKKLSVLGVLYCFPYKRRMKSIHNTVSSFDVVAITVADLMPIMKHDMLVFLSYLLSHTKRERRIILFTLQIFVHLTYSFNHSLHGQYYWIIMYEGLMSHILQFASLSPL